MTNLVSESCNATTALGALVERYTSPVYRLVHRILTGAGTEQDVEKCVSDVFHAAWRKIGEYDAAKAPLATWLLILAKYQALERRRGLAGAGAAVNQTVRLGRWNLRIIRTEVLETGLRVYVAPGAKATAKLDSPLHLAVNGAAVSHSGKLNDRTQQVEWLDFPVPSVMKSLKLSLTGASVTVSGPWVIDAPVQR